MPKLKRWKLKPFSDEQASKANKVSASLGIGKILSELLVQRGYETPEEAKAFLGKETTLFHNAFLLNDMERAVERISKAINTGEQITVYGDYDVDGVTSVSALYLYLSKKGASVNCYIPNRAGEGYGLNKAALDKLASEGTSLIITVDTGITAIDEAEYLKALGMELVVTDHHQCHSQLPDAVAVINPRRPDNRYPFDELAGVGVVFKLLCALEQREQERLNPNGRSDYLRTVCRDYCDLVAIGTIADVMPLRDENRLICAVGLANMEHSPRPGLAALIELTQENKNQRHPKKRRFTASYIGFSIAPKINAAGRLGDAMEGVKLFLSETQREAAEIAARLCELNTLRQAEENRIAAEAIELAEGTHDFEHDPILVLAKENWHHGVIGIVASRMTERYNMPAVLISIEDGIGKGSGRSIKGLNLSDALTDCADALIRYGGHELAAGLTVEAEKIDELRARLNGYARNHLTAEDSIPTLEIDRETHDGDVTLAMAEELSLLEPCGVDNPNPLFIRKNAQIADIVPIGMGGKHTKITLRSDGIPQTALLFGTSPAETDFMRGDTVDLVFQTDINEFQNVRTAQMLIRDARLCEAEICLYEKEMELYRRIVENGEQFTVHDRFLPDRVDFSAVYMALKKLCSESTVFGLHKISKTIALQNPDALPPMRMSKLKFCLKIFAEVGIIAMEIMPNPALCGTELYKLHTCKMTGKVNLEGAPGYKAIKRLLKRTEPED